MNPIRQQRLILVLLLLAGVSLATGLMIYALRENINHFYSPTQIVNGLVPEGARFRAGGIVVPGSVRRDEKGLTVFFWITDGAGQVEVEYTGILPDLFAEGQSIVGTGRLEGGRRFVADEILARHDENYMPPEVQRAIENAAPHPMDAKHKSGGAQ